MTWRLSDSLVLLGSAAIVAGAFWFSVGWGLFALGATAIAGGLFVEIARRRSQP